MLDRTTPDSFDLLCKIFDATFWVLTKGHPDAVEKNGPNTKQSTSTNSQHHVQSGIHILVSKNRWREQKLSHEVKGPKRGPKSQKQFSTCT